MHTVVLGALVDERRVLLALRSPRKQAYPGVWDLPGGVVEDGEGELSALSRELIEELGVHIDARAASRLADVTASPAGDLVRISAWLVDSWHGVPSNVAPDEHDALMWVDVDHLPQLAHAEVSSALVRAVHSRVRSRP